MKKKFLALGLLLSVVLQTAVSAQSKAVKPNKDALKAADSISAAQMRDYLYFIASDEMEGRDTPSRGLDTTAKFIGTLLARWGFKPAGDDGTFFQKMALRTDSVDPAKNTLEVGGEKAVFAKDFLRMSGNSGGAVTAPLVYVKDGWTIKSKNIDAYAGVDAKDKIVVVFADAPVGRGFLTPIPGGLTRQDLKNEDRNKDWFEPVGNAVAHGAKAVIVIASKATMGIWDPLVQNLGRGTTVPDKLRPAAPPQTGQTPPPPVIMVSNDFGAKLFAGTDSPLTSKNVPSVELKQSATLAIGGTPKTLWTQNVVALWEGTDPALKAEMVAIGAHYDHVGVNPAAAGTDKIWNGADDDGSGTTAVLSIAEALARSAKRPKRSVLFVWHCGEEKGLWGSEYFNKFPTVDIKKVIAQLNLDMIGRSKKTDDANPRNKDLSGENQIFVIGSQMMSSTLGDITMGINNSYLKLNYDTRYDDPKDTNRFFFRSDHFNYAVNGIPIVFWFDGVHEDYHQAGDEPQKIDYNKMEKVTRTIFLTLWQIADLKERPKVDKQLPPELSQR